MKTVELGQGTASLDEYVSRVRKQPVVVTRRGKPVAALVSVADADWESIALSTNPQFIRMIQRARA